MDGIFCRSLFRGQVKLLQNLLIGLRILLEPLSYCHLIGITIHVIENTSPGLVFIGPDKWPMPIMMVTLFVVFFLPDILVHLRASNPAIGCVCSCIVAYTMGHNAIQ